MRVSSAAANSNSGARSAWRGARGAVRGARCAVRGARCAGRGARGAGLGARGAKRGARGAGRGAACQPVIATTVVAIALNQALRSIALRTIAAERVPSDWQAREPAVYRLRASGAIKVVAGAGFHPAAIAGHINQDKLLAAHRHVCRTVQRSILLCRNCQPHLLFQRLICQLSACARICCANNVFAFPVELVPVAVERHIAVHAQECAQCGCTLAYRHGASCHHPVDNPHASCPRGSRLSPTVAAAAAAPGASVL